MKNIIIWMLLIMVVNCSVSIPDIPDKVVTASGETLQSDKNRVISPKVDSSDQAALIAGNSAFAFDIYQMLKDMEDNFIYSPCIISGAMAMVYIGARGKTGQEMADTLHFDLPRERLHPAFNWLEQELAKRVMGAGKDFQLNVVSAIWGQKDYKFMADFLDILAVNYGDGLRILDFINEPEKSRVMINDWVSKKTGSRIKDLIPEGVIDNLTRLVLTNTIYFNAVWNKKFDKKLTSNKFFNLLDGEKVLVPMMEQTTYHGYFKGKNHQIIELLYYGRKISMVILLPDTGRFVDFEKNLDFQQLKDIIQHLDDRKVTLIMPKFTFKTSFSLKKAFTKMGMADAFSGRADFSGITGNKDLFIEDVIHKAFIFVDEERTEAAAGNSIFFPLCSPVGVIVDRPFIFLIRDFQTGAILFMGRVLNPAV